MRAAWSRRGLLLLATCLVLSVGGVFTASALVSDRSVPSLTVLPSTGFTVGAQLEPSADFFDGYTDVPIHLEWQASDPSGVCNYSVYSKLTHAGGAAWPPQDLYDDPDVAAYDGVLSDYDGSFGGGGGYPGGFLVGADDCSFNGLRTVGWASNPTVYQEDGSSYTAGTPLPITYEGTWKTGSCECASGGTQRWTSEADASASFPLSLGKDTHLGLVMAKGPDRGEADVLVDGDLIGRVHSYRPAGNRNRVVVLSHTLGAGDHTVTIVNNASEGHPRIDLDAVLVGS